jgi:hypothetical protein
MKKHVLRALLVAWCWASIASAQTTTPNFGWTIPAEHQDPWYNSIVSLFNEIDATVASMSASGGVGKTGSPLNSHCAFWTGTNTISGEAACTWDAVNDILKVQRMQALGTSVTVGTSGSITGTFRLQNATNANEAVIASTTPTATRTFTLPNADSNPVQPLSCAGSTFVKGVAGTGLIDCQTPAGSGGNVNNVGTPTNGQIGQWTGATTLQGITLVPVSAGGTNLNVATDDTIMIGNGTTWQPKPLPVGCAGATNALAYDSTTNAVICNTIATAAATASYITRTAEAGLSAESSLGLLTTGLLFNTVSAAVGTPSTYTGTTPCTSGQFMTSLSGAGVAVCGTPPAGGGNMSNVGTPTNGQIGQWTGAQTMQGITLVPVASGGTNLASGTSGGILGYTAAGTLASSVALGANLPVLGGGAGATPISGTRSGNTTEYATSTGTKTTNNCVKWDASGNLVDHGAACGGAGGGNVSNVGTPTNGQFAQWTGATTIQGVTVVPVASGGTGLASGTSGGIPGYTAAGTLASSGALPAGLPVVGGGAGAVPTSGTRSGNTTQYVTTTGTQTSGDCVKIDANGNHVANGSACGGASSGPTIALVTSDVTHAQSNATFTDVTGLAWTVCATATEVWQFDLNLLMTAENGTADFRYQWTFPTGVTMAWQSVDNMAAVLASGTPVAVLDQTSVRNVGAFNGMFSTLFRGWVFCSTASNGPLQLQFNQILTNATNIVVKKGSNIIATKLIP